MKTKKIHLLLKTNGKKAESLSFTDKQLLVGATEVADIKVQGENMPSVICKLSMEEGRLRVDLVEDEEPLFLKEGESFPFGADGSSSLVFQSFSEFKETKENVKSLNIESALASADKMLSADSDLMDVEAEAESYLYAVKTAEERISEASQKADIQFQSKLSQSSARAHRILEQTSREIEDLTAQAQKKVHYLNHEIEEKSAQLHKTILFLEGQTAQKQESLEAMHTEIEDLEYKKVALKKDIRLKEQEFGAIQAEYKNLINSRKDEILHLTEDANQRRNDLQEINEKLILEERRFEEKTFVLKKSITNLEAETEEKEKLILLLKENYRNLEEDIEGLKHSKERAAIKVREEEGILEVLIKKKDLIKTETQRIISQSKEEAMNVTKAAVLKAEELKREALEAKNSAEEQALSLLEETKNEAKRIASESKENAQKLIDVARVDAKQVLTSAEATLEQAKLDYNKKLKEAETEKKRLNEEAYENKQVMLKEIEAKRKEQMLQIDEELKKFKEGLAEKKATHLKVVSDSAESQKKKETVLDEFNGLVRDFKDVKAEDVQTLPVEESVVEEEENLVTDPETATSPVLELVKEEEPKVQESKEVEAEVEVESAQETVAAFEAATIEEQEESTDLDSHNEGVSDRVTEALTAFENEEESIEQEAATGTLKSDDSIKEKSEPLNISELLSPLKGAYLSGLSFSKSVYKHKHFKVAVPSAMLLLFSVIYAPKLMTQIKEQRQVAKENKEIEVKKAETELAKKEEAKSKKRDLASTKTNPLKAIDVYHQSYTDRVVYTQDYMKNEFKSTYRSKWISAMRTFVKETAKLPDSELAPIITTETALLRALDQMHKKSKNTALMTKLEEQLLAKLKTQLKSEEMFAEFFKLKSKTYKEEYSVK